MLQKQGQIQRQGQKILEFEVSLGYTVRFFPNKTNKQTKITTNQQENSTTRLNSLAWGRN